MKSVIEGVLKENTKSLLSMWLPVLDLYFLFCGIFLFSLSYSYMHFFLKMCLYTNKHFLTLHIFMKLSKLEKNVTILYLILFVVAKWIFIQILNQTVRREKKWNISIKIDRINLSFLDENNSSLMDEMKLCVMSEREFVVF